jgi:glycosyltransferase involved in cell wall biosynthesis
MKIFFDYKIFFQQSYGGPSNYFVNLNNEINKYGEQDIQSKIFAPFFISKELNEAKNKKDHFGIILPSIFNSVVFLRYLNEKISSFYLNHSNFDIYHTTYYGNNLSLKRKLPVIVTVFDLIHEIYKETYYKNLKKCHFKKEVLDRADHIICISKNTQNDLINFYNINKKKTSVIYLGKFYKDLINNNKNILKFKKPFFLYVGNRHNYKNFMLLLKSYSLSKKIMTDFDLLCFGGGNFSDREIVAINQLKIPLSNIKNIQGNNDVLRELYFNAFALVYPSLYEGFGLPVLDAMTLGCPVISSNSSSLPEVYGNAAISFNPNSESELLNSFTQITEDNFLRKEMIKKGIEVSKLFSWKKCAEQTIEVYKKFV